MGLFRKFSASCIFVAVVAAVLAWAVAAGSFSGQGGAALVGAVAAAVFAACGLGLAVRFIFLRPLTAVEQGLRDLAEGRLKAARPSLDKDLPGIQTALKQAERVITDKNERMAVAAQSLEDAMSRLSGISGGLSRGIQQSDSGAAMSAERLSEAAAAMNEMNATVQDVARNAEAASGASALTREKAEAGAQVVEKAVRSIKQAREVFLAFRQDMGQLDEHARAISQIMDVISDIADQTNLLALNAAIEAARAGEAGRGFAVVADEVRNLAEKTMTSTHDVGEAIKAIQESTAKSMNSAAAAVSQIEQATDLAGQSGQALEEIVSTVENTAGQVSAIAAACEQQSAASEEINRSIAEVNGVAADMAQSMREAREEMTRLVELAGTLEELMARLKE